ncbi:hypothetical protein Poli38472_013073 [Pythium oligandrum]|uniref:Acyltransferase n=1 Tax=Pythium oligandrum TaxID=41045 RepID=A0A8K1CKK8_PYTOL|nr:hypothetical protein Poli38472_013073 [Pythium oligandrum]|eukprot:TMW64451.1 hypothetical protein Poli38472_013073 [Pythium oligandrum]
MSTHGESEEKQPLLHMDLDRKDGVLVYETPQYWEGSKVPQWMRRVIEDVFSFVLIHYNMWPTPVVILFYYMVKNGYGLIVVALVALYLPRFLNGKHSTADGGQWDAFRQMGIWQTSANFLGIKIIREQALEAGKRYIFGYHPHGIIVMSRIATYGGNWEKLFPGIEYRVLGASTMFWVPFGRDLCLWLGGVDASRSTAEKVLKSNKSITVFPGGVPEIFLTDPKSKENVLVLKKRLGFVKLAIRQGADLVPCFVFNEKFLYKVWNPPKALIAFFRKTLQIPLIFFWGRFLWMPLQPPKEKTFGIVYGKPIAVTQNENPTDEELHTVHAKYMAEIERLFNDYKKTFGYDDDETLVIT